MAGVAAIVITATTAFFSDTETSTGNIFTAGEIDLKVDSQQHYNNAVCVNGFWALEDGAQLMNPQYPVIDDECGGTWGQPNGKDIVGEKFFDFADIKPGDSGENTISLHVDNNDAWMCADFTTDSDENGLVEPEEEMNDTSDFGELGRYLEIMWWKDDGNNKLDSGETPLYGGPMTLEEWLAINNGPENHGDGTLLLTISDTLVNALGNSVGTPVEPNETFYIAAAWCLGTIIINEGGNGYVCDGELVPNDAQTDKLTADVNFEVVQARNNSDFVCAEHRETPAP